MARTAASADRPMTLADWADQDEDDEGELVDGRLEREELPTTLHELAVMWLAAELTLWARRHRGLVFGSQHKLGVAPRRGRKADLCVYLARDEKPELHASLSRVPPSIVVEVLSPRPRDQRRDRVEKPRDYARFGVRWYWLVDPAVQLVEIRELARGGKYVQVGEQASGRLRVPGCRGLSLDLDALWQHLGLASTRVPRKRSR